MDLQHSPRSHLNFSRTVSDNALEGAKVATWYFAKVLSRLLNCRPADVTVILGQTGNVVWEWSEILGHVFLNHQQ